MDEETEVGEEMEKVKTKEVREIIVSAVDVYKAAMLADDLLKCLRTMKHGRWAGADAFSLHSVVEKIENGKTFEDVMEEIEKEILLTLVRRHETSKELAVVLKKGEGAVRAMLMRRGISLREPKQQGEVG